MFGDAKLCLYFSPVVMLAQIELHLESLITRIASSGATPEKVAALRREVQTARRNRFRQEQREIEHANQEERARRAFLRAQAPAPPKLVSHYSSNSPYLLN